MSNQLFKRSMIFGMILTVLFGSVGMSMLYSLAGWKWAVCVGALMGAMYCRITAYVSMIGYMQTKRGYYAFSGWVSDPDPEMEIAHAEPIDRPIRCKCGCLKVSHSPDGQCNLCPCFNYEFSAKNTEGVSL